MPSNFCISIQEISNFIQNSNLYMGDLPKTFCPITSDFISGEKVCQFGIDATTLRNMTSNCVRVSGNITIEAGDEEFVYKLKSMKYLFGSLKIFNVNLTQVDFLSSLEYVVTLDSELRLYVKLVMFFQISQP